MNIIIGLGNPGEKYIKTRHNVGFLFCELLARQLSVGDNWNKNRGLLLNKLDSLLLVKSADYYMNESGKIITDLNYLGLNEGEVWVVHDDLDLKLGEFKIQKGKGPQLHGGLNSIDVVTGKDYWRIRVGIDTRDKENRIPGEEYVLQDFLPEEMDKLQSVLYEIAKRFA